MQNRFENSGFDYTHLW